MATEALQKNVKTYYGQTLRSSSDLKTSACTTRVAVPPHVLAALAEVHDEVKRKFYGCGLTIPDELERQAVLDLGSGSGRDCFALSKLVGAEGSVLGVDMTREQLAVAEEYVEYHTRKFQYYEPNVSFKEGVIEDLTGAGVPDASMNIVVSNCVINLLSHDAKASVLREVYRVLRPGGEMYFSDVYADRRVPAGLLEDPVLHGECLSGAMYWQDFMRLAREAGFRTVRMVECEPITMLTPAIAEAVGDIGFVSVTFRLFKMDGGALEETEEDYGQAVRYKGTLQSARHHWRFDAFSTFPTGKIVPVSRNTFALLSGSRFARHFDFFDGVGTHFGPFPVPSVDATIRSVLASSPEEASVSAAGQASECAGGVCPMSSAVASVSASAASQCGPDGCGPRKSKCCS